MEEMIIVQLQPTDLEHSVYIISNNTEMVPLIKKATVEELPSVVAMSAAKYNINCIKLAGPHSYTCGIREIKLNPVILATALNNVTGRTGNL